MARQFTPVPGDGIHQSVLIVDDEPMARTLLRLMLVRAGFHVSEAEDGYDALDKVRKNQPDVVLLDVMMPGMDGPTTLQRLRDQAELAATPVAFVTAKVQPQEVAHFKSIGAVDFIAKPFDPMALADQIRDLWMHCRNG